VREGRSAPCRYLRLRPIGLALRRIADVNQRVTQSGNSIRIVGSFDLKERVGVIAEGGLQAATIGEYGAAAQSAAGQIGGGLKSGTLHEPNHDFANAGLNLNRYLVEPSLNLRTPVAGLPVVQHQIVDATDRFLEHRLAINQENNRRFVFKVGGVEAECLVGEVNLETVFAVG